MRNSSWKDWFGAEVGFSIYIHIGGVSLHHHHHHHSYPSQGVWARPARVRALLGSHQHAGNPTVPVSFTPLLTGLFPRLRGVRRARAEAVYCSAICRVKAWRKRQRAANDTQSHEQAEAWERALRNPEYMALKSPHWGNVWRSGLCWTVAWRAKTSERANPRRRPLPTPRGRRAGAMAARGCQQTRETGPRGRLERDDDL